MGKYPCVITFTDRSQVQQTVENSEFNTFCNDNSIIYSREFRNYISEIFVNGSMNRSLFYVDIKVKDFIPRRNRQNAFCPVYGVKGGTPGVTRKTNYAEILFCRENDISGTEFNDRIFGLNYLSGEETTRLSEAAMFEKLDRPSDLPEYHVRSENRKLVSRTLEKLWEQQERNPQTRFVIRMKNAEDRSAVLLQQLYTLLPQQIRLQMGFQTNITATDLEQIQTYGGIPIYVLTMDSFDTIRTDAFDAFPVYVFDTDDLDSYSYDPGRLELIQQLMNAIDRESSYILDYAEKKILEAKESTVSSFKYYEEIVTKLLDGTFFWWMKDSIESLEEVERLYQDQKGLMSVDTFRNKALVAFMMKYLPNSDISNQITNMILNESYPNRGRLLRFAADELKLRKPIEAANNLVHELKQEKENVLSEANRNWTEKMRLKEEEHKKQTAAIDNKCKSLEENNKNLNNQISQLSSDLREMRNGLEEDEKIINDKNGVIERLKKEVESLRDQEIVDHSDKSIKDKIRNLNKQIQEQKIYKMVFMVLTVVMLLSSIAFFALFMGKAGAVKKLSSSVEEMKTAHEILLLEHQETEEKLREAEKKISEFEGEKSGEEGNEAINSGEETPGQDSLDEDAETDTVNEEKEAVEQRNADDHVEE